MTTHWNQDFTDFSGSFNARAHAGLVTSAKKEDAAAAFASRIKSPQSSLYSGLGRKARGDMQLHQFADAFCSALRADACSIFEQCDDEASTSGAAFRQLGLCSYFRCCGDAIPDLDLPDQGSDLRSISLGNSCTINFCTHTIAPTATGPLGRYSQMLHVSFPVTADRMWVIQLYRSDADKRFSDDIQSQLLPVLPLVVDQAVMLAERQSRMAVLAVGRHIADQLTLGLLCLDAHCQLNWSNSAGRDFLKNADPLIEKNGHVSIRRRHENAIMHAHVAKVCEEPNLSFNNYLVMEAVHSASTHPYLLHILPAGGIVGRASAFLLVFNPETSLASALTPVCEALGLSPSESRLAIALSDGASIKEAAETIGIKEYTARTYLKQIFGKVRVQRQADLVRVLLKSALPLRGNSFLP